MREFTSKVDCILKRHSGIGVKTLRFKVGDIHSVKDCCHLYHLDSWLHSAVKPGIEELDLTLSGRNAKYNFPCSLLYGGTGDSLLHLVLASCHFHPTELLCLKSLTRLSLAKVDILEDELEFVLSNSFSLEQLELRHCNNIVCLKIPCLQRLSSLEVFACSFVQVIESKAPNISNFSMPNLEALSICSCEVVNTPIVNSKFLHLKVLNIIVGGHAYDLLSLVSFFDSSPSLETFTLNVMPVHGGHVSIFGDHLDLTMVPGHHHDKLKHVEIINFSSAKNLIEFTCHILLSARSLERLTLDTTLGFPRCSASESGKCLPMRKDALAEAHRALLAVQTYIKPNVPPTVELKALGPCSRCHVELGLYY
ncbi:hypothetical protein PR202_gb09797 [Eleusine coracana subsp. coracana]|uniref:FBD domain-containing protein n=1 Tax=Eleusine coracana subsp. coracana TaxID=191504 RepID=A0AAV5EIH9_ELECO|nr:hypothetical protein PR202_gb09797 [Eleusine coracana subsp. coracana]